jgi:hypothetical protein
MTTRCAPILERLVSAHRALINSNTRPLSSTRRELNSGNRTVGDQAESTFLRMFRDHAASDICSALLRDWKDGGWSLANGGDGAKGVMTTLPSCRRWHSARAVRGAQLLPQGMQTTSCGDIPRMWHEQYDSNAEMPHRSANAASARSVGAALPPSLASRGAEGARSSTTARFLGAPNRSNPQAHANPPTRCRAVWLPRREANRAPFRQARFHTSSSLQVAPASVLRIGVRFARVAGRRFGF